MREIKFRAWHKKEKKMYLLNWTGDGLGYSVGSIRYSVNADDYSISDRQYEIMQYTGLKDKNGTGQEIYEGDIIDQNGNIKGNIYETDKEPTDLVIEGLGSKAWDATYKKAVERGCEYTE